MKLIYSHLQKFIPSLNVEPQKLRDDLTMIGHFTNYFEEIEGEIVFDLDIKVNRGDCLGYYGLARDLATYYHLDLVTPNIDLPATDYQLPITVTSPDVYRVMCLKLSGLKVSSSPEWLSKFVRLHQVNSVNNIVDLTNYIMFMYGIPNHAFDVAKTGENLIWENNNGKSHEFTTLDGTVFKLTNENLVISNPTEVVSTDFVGGRDSGTYDSTTEIIIEVAIYNPNRIRLDSRQHKTVTEAGIRLEKQLDCELVPQAVKHLAQLITQNSGAQVTSSIYDYYPNPSIIPAIEFDFSLPTKISGIEIPVDFAIKSLQSIGCTINGNQVTPPSIRKDINLKEDLAEEVIRFYGYQNIPIDQPLGYQSIPEITPPILKLIDSLKDKLTSLGYDEVLTWPLTSSPEDPATVVKAQNSINAEYPYLRQSIRQTLLVQLDLYQRFKLPHPQFFEIGKVYYQKNGQYYENYALGIYHYDANILRRDVLQNVSTDTKVENNFAEIILDETILVDYDITTPQHSAVELTSQIITLDANVTIDPSTPPSELISHYQQLIDKNILWSIEISDIYQSKCTFRVSYFNCDDKTAKKVHLSTFNLD